MAPDLSELQELLDRFETDQRDLDELCAPRALDSHEVWAPNDLYGAATVLKRYAGVPDTDSVCAVIPHGVYFDVDPLSPAERDSCLPAVLVFPPYRTAAYQRGTGMVTIPFASPFVYAERLVDFRGARRGTLFFPAHSTAVVSVQTDWDALADQLLRLPEHMHPVTVIVYWQDYLLNHHLPFLERGLPVVSAGHSHDRDFLLRQAYLLKKHRYAASNAIGSHTFYSVQAGCPFHIIDRQYEYVVGDEDAFRLELKAAPSLIWPPSGAERELVGAFAVRSGTITPEQRRLADYYLGTAFAMRPEEMAALFRWLSRLRLFGKVMLWAPTPRRLRADGAAVRSWLPVVRKSLPAIAARVVRGWASEGIRLARVVFPFLRDVRLRRRWESDRRLR